MYLLKVTWQLSQKDILSTALVRCELVDRWDKFPHGRTSEILRRRGDGHVIEDHVVCGHVISVRANYSPKPLLSVFEVVGR